MLGTLFIGPPIWPRFVSTLPRFVIIFFPRFLVRLFYCNVIAIGNFGIIYQNCRKVALLMGGLMGCCHQGSPTGSSSLPGAPSGT